MFVIILDFGKIYSKNHEPGKCEFNYIKDCNKNFLLETLIFKMIININQDFIKSVFQDIALIPWFFCRNIPNYYLNATIFTHTQVVNSFLYHTKSGL